MEFGEFHILLGELHKFYHKPFEKSLTDVDNRCLALGLFHGTLLSRAGTRSVRWRVG